MEDAVTNVPPLPKARAAAPAPHTMGLTLFKYVFRDLLKIFLMTAGVLAGAMSFGALIRPLTQRGLDPEQVSQMLVYLNPAMMAYALPVAALFAATVVYGRLSADNELTACRAGGIGLGAFGGMAFPVLVFGFLAAGISLAFLCFVVPASTLKAERVIYANVAKLIANNIERTHEIKFGGVTIFAQRAYVPPPDPAKPNRQQVVLEGVSFVNFEKPAGGDAPPPPTRPARLAGGTASAPAADETLKGRFALVPKEFLMASSATIDIQEPEHQDDPVSLMIGLRDGVKYPREFTVGTHVGIGVTQFGPIESPSMIKEDTKFMDVGLLRELYRKPDKSRKITGMVQEYVRRDQVRRYAELVLAELNGPRRFVQFKGAESTIGVSLDPSAAPPAVAEGSEGEEVRVAGTAPGTVTFERSERTSPRTTLQAAQELRVRARPDTARKVMVVTVELYGRSPGGATTRPVSGNYSDVIEVPMPPEVLALSGGSAVAYARSATLPRKDRDQLRRELIVLSNNILAEANGRASFATSNLILVLVGAALGMMFKSGNFLTAFAISFVPALLCITLIVAGQQMCHAVPFQFETKANPLRAGVALIWSGNAINLVIAAVLMWRIQRQ
ncbi:MAG: lipopolysaccharide transporter permease LptF [Phycisphaerales bacterium]|nr:lipopolysaccharide transporter permease LptF [Phycisphaerales bacterium]